MFICNQITKYVLMVLLCNGESIKFMLTIKNKAKSGKEKMLFLVPLLFLFALQV